MKNQQIIIGVMAVTICVLTAWIVVSQANTYYKIKAREKSIVMTTGSDRETGHLAAPWAAASIPTITTDTIDVPRVHFALDTTPTPMEVSNKTMPPASPVFALPAAPPPGIPVVDVMPPPAAPPSPPAPPQLAPPHGLALPGSITPPTIEPPLAPKAPPAKSEPKAPTFVYGIVLRAGGATRPNVEIRAGERTLVTLQSDWVGFEGPKGNAGKLPELTAMGHVSITGPGIEAVCDQLAVQASTSELILRGNVRMTCCCGAASSKINADQVVIPLAQIGTTPHTSAVGVAVIWASYWR